MGKARPQSETARHHCRAGATGRAGEAGAGVMNDPAPAEAPAPVRASERFIVRRGTKFAEMSVDTYEPAQHEATVFCLHDYLGNSRDFRQLGAFLSAHNYRVVCPDMFGRGDSAYLDEPQQYRMETHLFGLMAVMQRFADQ